MNTFVDNPGLSSIATKVFMYLDTSSLAKCRLVCYSWFYFINEQMFWWIRILEIMKSRPFLQETEWQTVIQSIEKDKPKLRQLLIIFLNYSHIEPDFTPMHYVADEGDMEDVEFLFSFQELVLLSHKCKKKNYPRPVHFAAKKGHVQVVRWILYKFRDLSPCTNDDGLSVIHIASQYGQVNLLKEIISLVDDKIPKDINGECPLHFAAKGGNFEAFCFMTEYCEEINPGDIQRDTPLHFAASQASTHSSSHGHIEIVRYLLSRLDDKNPRNHLGNTPLHRAADIGNCNIVKMIITQVEDKNPKNANRRTPLHYAAVRGHFEVFKIIAETVNANEKNPKDAKGWTPLHFAAGKGHLEIVQYLLPLLKDKNPKNKLGITPLNYAMANQQRDEVIQYLQNK